MSRADILGLWYCHTVDQEQSDEEAEEYGEYDDFGREPQKASKTEHAQTKIDFRDDGTYVLTGADDYMNSTGTWAHDDGSFEMTEVEPAGGYDGLEYASFYGDQITLGYKLIPDAHDGLDVLVLSFGREAPKARGPKPEGLVDQLLAAEDEDEVWNAMDEALEEKGRDPAEVNRELWDAVVAGTLLAAPESDHFYVEIAAFGDDRVREASGFTHDHALHLLPKIDGRSDERFDLLVDVLPTLPADPKDEQLAEHLHGEWITRFAQSRFLGGGAPEELFRRPVFPQPQMDDACRAYALRSDYTRFESIEHLFPPGHPDAARAVLRYRGRDLLKTPLAFLRDRDLRAEALAAVRQMLADDDTMRWLGIRQSACILGIALSTELSEPIPELVFERLQQEAKGTMFGSMTPEEKGMIEEMIAELPEPQREIVTTRLHLDKT